MGSKTKGLCDLDGGDGGGGGELEVWAEGGWGGGYMALGSKRNE